MKELIYIILFLIVSIALPLFIFSGADLTYWDSLFIRGRKEVVPEVNIEEEFTFVFPQKQLPTVFFSACIVLSTFIYFKYSTPTFLIVTIIVISISAYKAKSSPYPPVVISKDNITVYNKVTAWKEIQKIEFTSAKETYITPKGGPGSTLPRWAIVLVLNDFNEIRIYMASYKNSRQMRAIIERVALLKGIKVNVFDRGL